MKIFNPRECTTPPRADMFLPNSLKNFGFSLDTFAVIFLIVAFVTKLWVLLIGVAFFGIFGIAAWLCWKNQTLKIIGEDKFEYTTFLGKTTVYRFSDIKKLRVNQDSWTLILTNGKVHIESMVYMSEALYNKIESAINKEKTS